MKMEKKSKWQRNDNEEFKSIIQTRNQMRNQQNRIDDKKVKEPTNPSDKDVNLTTVKEHIDKAKEAAKPTTSTHDLEIVNKFFNDKFGIDFAKTKNQGSSSENPQKNSKTTEDKKSPTQTTKNENQPIENKPESTNSIVNPNVDNPVQNDTDARLSSKQQTSPLAVAVHKLPETQITPVKTVNTLKMEEMLLEKYQTKFLSRCKEIAKIIDSKKSDIPPFTKVKQKYTKLIIKNNKSRMTVENVGQIILDIIDTEFDKIKKDDVFKEEDLRIVLEHLNTFMLDNYLEKQEEVISRIKVPVKKRNKKNQFMKERIPLLKETIKYLKTVQDDIREVGENKVVNMEDIRSDVVNRLLGLRDKVKKYNFDPSEESILDSRKRDLMSRTLNDFEVNYENIVSIFQTLEASEVGMNAIAERNKDFSSHLSKKIFGGIELALNTNGIDILEKTFESHFNEFDN